MNAAEARLKQAFSRRSSRRTPQLSPSAVSVSVRTYGNPTQSYLEFYVYGAELERLAEKILAAKSIFYLFMSFGSIVPGVPVRRRKFVGGNADIRSHVEIFWVGGMLSLMTFYALFRYKLAQRLKCSTAD